MRVEISCRDPRSDGVVESEYFRSTDAAERPIVYGVCSRNRIRLCDLAVDGRESSELYNDELRSSGDRPSLILSANAAEGRWKPHH